VALGGLRTLGHRLTIAGYERAGGLPGLEAGFVNRGLDAAVRASGLPRPTVLDLVLALVDRERQPPAKAPPRTAVELAATIASPLPPVLTALATLAREEIARARGEETAASAPWQLDHDYLAGPILRLERERDRWRLLLAERDKIFREAGLNLGRRWRTLLPLKDQLRLAAARLGGRFRYGEYRAYAILSWLRLAPTLLLLSTLATGWWVYEQASSVQRVWGRLILSGDDLSPRETEALLEISRASWLERRLFTSDLLTRPEFVERFAEQPAPVLRALVGTSVPRARRLLRRALPIFLSEGIKIYEAKSARAMVIDLKSVLLSAEVTQILQSVLNSLKASTDYSTAVALAEAYEALAAKLDPAQAPAQLN
jgi:hypothetical protein